MNSNNLMQEILDLFQGEFELEVPSVKTNLMENGYMDSLRFVQLLALLEERFDITISIEDLEFENFQTIENMAGFIEEVLPDNLTL